MNSNPFRNLFNIDKSYWLLVFPILHATMPWIQYRFRGMVPFVFVMLWVLPKLPRIIAETDTHEGRFFLSSFWCFFALLFLQEFFAIIGSQSHMKYYQIAVAGNSLLWLVVAFHTMASRKFNELRFLTIVTLVGFILSGVGVFLAPDAEVLESARKAVALRETEAGQITLSDIDAAQTIYTYGMGGYGHMYNCAWIFGIALLAFFISKNKNLKILYFLAMTSTTLNVKSGGLGTPFALVMVEAMLFLVWMVSRSKRAVSMCGYSLIFVFAIYANNPHFFGFLVKPLVLLGRTMQEGAITERVLSVADAFSGSESYANFRAQLQLKSFRAFCRHPFFGVFGPFAGGSQMDLGGHSYVLDIMGGYGLFGTIVLGLFVRSLLRYFNVLGQMYFGGRWLVMPVFFMAVFIFSGIMNPVAFFANAVYLMPGIAWLALSPQEQKGVLWHLGPMGWRPNPYRHV